MNAATIINVLLGLTQLVSAGVDVKEKIDAIVAKAQAEGRDVTVIELSALLSDRKAALAQLLADLG